MQPFSCNCKKTTSKLAASGPQRLYYQYRKKTHFYLVKSQN